jgi:hypothetical protein
MAIKNILNKLLNEEVEKKYQTLFNTLYIKWKNDDSRLNIEEGEIVFNAYMRIKNNIVPTSDIVQRFLFRHNGDVPNLRKLEFEDLKKIEFLRFREIVTLLDFFSKINVDFLDKDEDENVKLAQIQNKKRLDAIFDTSIDDRANPERVAESKKMWYDTSTALISEGGLRVYEIKNQEQIVRMGYYYQNISARAQTIEGRRQFATPWCITCRGNHLPVRKVDENGNEYGDRVGGQVGNLYTYYRDENKLTFYFIIDDNRPITDPYHIASLGVKPWGTYQLTNQFNGGDVTRTWEYLVNEFPQLEGKKELFKSKSFDKKDEVKKQTLLDIVNENEGNEYEFRRLPISQQEKYIQQGGYISKPISWQILTRQLKSNYINTINAGNVLNKFNNLPFIKEVMKDSGKHLDFKLRQISDGDNMPYKNGFKDLILKYIGNNYNIKALNILNDRHAMVRNYQNKKYGIFDFNSIDWLNYDGINFECNYSEDPKSKQIYFGSGNQQFVLEKYNVGGSESDKSIYSLIDVKALNDKKVQAYFFTHKKWEELLKSKKLQPKSAKMPLPKIKINNPQSDFDIKEELG